MKKSNAATVTGPDNAPVVIKGSNMGLTIIPEPKHGRIILDDDVDYIEDPALRAALVDQSAMEAREFFKDIRNR